MESDVDSTVDYEDVNDGSDGGLLNQDDMVNSRTVQHVTGSTEYGSDGHAERRD